MATRKPNYLLWGILLVGGYLLYEESKKKATAIPDPTPPLSQGNGTALPTLPSAAQTVVAPSQPTTAPINIVPASNFVMEPSTETAPVVTKTVPSGPAWSVRANYAR
jgi:hypothetical protein